MLPVGKEFCEEAGFASSLRTIDSFLVSLGTKEEDRKYVRTGPPFGPTRIDVAEFETEVRHIRLAIEQELKEHSYVHVLPDRLEYLNKDRLFGKAISRAFPSASYDIREAGNCLAVEACTAAVFHLMRAAEFALRALAFDRRVRVPRGPLDLANWEDIIAQLEKAEVAIQGYPKTHAREAQYDFYHGAMMEFKRFKNKFRNRVTHTREEYDRDQAHSALTHVREFMKILASRISETKRTPRVWKGNKWTTVES